MRNLLLSLLIPLSLSQASQQFPNSIHSPPVSSISPSSISRLLELGGAIAKDFITYTFPDDQSVAGQILYIPVSSEEKKGLSAVESWEGKAADGTKAKTGRLELRDAGKFEEDGKSTYYYSLHIPRTTSSRTFTLSLLHTLPSTPLPKSLPQTTTDGQYFLYSGSLLSGIPSTTSLSSLSVKIRTPTPRVANWMLSQGEEEWDVDFPSGGTTISFTAKNARSVKEGWAQVRYEQPSPVFGFKDYERTVEVGHWTGDYRIKEAMTVRNLGPELEGNFARIAHQSATFLRHSLPHIITSLTFYLPPAIHSPYYVDLVGNVSTSRFSPSRQKKNNLAPITSPRDLSRLDIFPRYPVMGGWNYTFEIGYKGGLEAVERKLKDGRYGISVKMLTPVNEAVFENVKTRVVLPEGATDIEYLLPYAMDSVEHTMTKSWLDTTGRPTIIFEKSNCVDRHGVDILITYKYSTLALLRKPLGVSAVFFSIMLTAMAAKRFEWVIGRK